MRSTTPFPVRRRFASVFFLLRNLRETQTLTCFLPTKMSSSDPDLENQKKQSKPLNLLQRYLNPIQNRVSSHSLFWVFITFFVIQCIVISVIRSPPPPCFPDRTAKTAADISSAEFAHPSNDNQRESNAQSDGQKCPFGQVYVYDLPSTFSNDLLLHNCTDLEPYNWECGIVTNLGFGSPAAELRSFLPENLAKFWYRTNQFSLELIFHRRILQHPCRTTEPESATAFYIPFYGGLAVGKYLWIDDIPKRDRLCNMMLDWVTNQKYWKRFNGSDHFLTLGRVTWDFRRLTDPENKWGSNLLNLPVMKNVMRFIIEKANDDDHDIAVPYPTGFHPSTRQHLNNWQDFVRNYNRTHLFTFIGATRPSVQTDVRSILHSQCRNDSDVCWLVDCAVEPCVIDSSAPMKALLGSDFCLQPIGDSATRKSVFDCMVAGSVPVFFWKQTAYEQYEGFLPGQPESYSVYVDHDEVKSGTSRVKEVLMKYSKEEVRKKREKVMETIPRLIYGDWKGETLDFKDAFDVAVDGVMERTKEEREWVGFL